MKESKIPFPLSTEIYLITKFQNCFILKNEHIIY